MEPYRIYALKYAGPFERREAFLLWLGDFERTDDVYYYIWLIRSKDEAIVVDAGVAPALAAERELTGYTSPADVLARTGIEASKIKHVILTHLHWDHMDGDLPVPGRHLLRSAGGVRFLAASTRPLKTRSWPPWPPGRGWTTWPPWRAPIVWSSWTGSGSSSPGCAASRPRATPPASRPWP